MEQLIAKLAAAYPQLLFQKSSTFMWSGLSGTVFYSPTAATNYATAAQQLLHETAHGLLAHTNYRYDIELIHLEVAAWEQAKVLATKFGVLVDESHIQDCLDTYRDWLYRRSTCPVCYQAGLQTTSTIYACINCAHQWRVTKERLCRPYRSKTTPHSKKV